MNLFRLVFALFIIANSLALKSQEFNVISYNIRYDNPHDNEDWWGHRKEAVVQLLKNNEPLVFGVQEAVSSQMDYINEYLPDYSYLGVGRDDGKEAGEFSAVFYNSAKLELLDDGTFWLSNSPNVVSKGWDAALPRICTYAKFKLKDNVKEFWVFNTHFDHVGLEARDESSKLIISKIKEITDPNDAVILTGDFNTTPDKAPYANITAYMEDSAKASAAKPEGPIGTFNGFKLDAPLKERIDYIYSKNIQVLQYKHLDTKRDNGLWVSDHLPVLAKVTFR